MDRSRFFCNSWQLFLQNEGHGAASNNGERNIFYDIFFVEMWWHLFV